MPAPILLFVYNRPLHTRAVLEALRNNTLAGDSVLYIYADGPKENATDQDRKNIDEVRALLQEEQWCKEVYIRRSEKNKGLAPSVIEGVTDILKEYDRVIVLEDDLVSSVDFLRFMNAALDTYEKDDTVACISGYIYPLQEPVPETFFIRGADCWGWAAWRRSWAVFEPNGSLLLQQLKEKDLLSDFNFFGSYPYSRMLEDQIRGRNSSWAIRWYASAYLRNKLVLYPGHSYIRNIGLDGSGTHSGKKSNWNEASLNTFGGLKKIPPEENKKVKMAIAAFFRSAGKRNIFSGMIHFITGKLK
jgi:hypothetical protein